MVNPGSVIVYIVCEWLTLAVDLVCEEFPLLVRVVGNQVMVNDDVLEECLSLTR